MSCNCCISGRWTTFALLLALVLPCAAQKAAPKKDAASKKPPASLTQIEESIRRDPSNPKLYVELGLAYWDQNDYPHAYEAFQQAVKVGPSSAEAHNWLGVAILEKSDLPGATAEFRRAVALDPKYARAYTNLGSALAKGGDLAEAVSIFRKALALEPNDLGAQMNLGIALREKGDADAALVYIRRVAKAQSDNANIQYELGHTLRQNGDLAGAVAAFDRALEIDPEMRQGYYALGLALKQQSAAMRKALIGDRGSESFQKAKEAASRADLNSARDQLNEVLRANEADADAHNLLGFILGQQGDLAAALPHLQRAVALRAGDSQFHYDLGVALWYSGSRGNAVSELRESVRLDPAAGAGYGFLGTALRESGDLPGARANLQRAIALLPPLAATYIDLGIVFLRMGNMEKALGQLEAGLNMPSSPTPVPDWDAAIDGLRSALAEKPNQAEAHNVLGLLLGRKGADNKLVTAEFREAIRLRPDYAEADNNLGLVLTQADDDAAAIAAFREAIRISPDYADAHANLGATLIPDDADQAIVELEKAVSLAPELTKAQFNLAMAYAASPTHGPAKESEQLRKVIAAAPNFARAHLALGKALLQEAKVPEAVAELQEAAKLDPQSGESHYQLGLALNRSGRKEEGAAEVQKGRELSAADERNQNADLDISEGRKAMESGELEQAVAKFRHAIKLQPESSDAQRYLGAALESQGDGEGAIAAYHKALTLNPGDQAAKKRLDALSPSPVLDDQDRISELENYIREAKYKEVEPLLLAYVAQYPKSSWGWYALGYSRFAQQKIGESIQALAQALQLDIRNAEAHKILGRDLMIIGRFDAAQTEFEQAIKYDPQSAEMHYNLGKLFAMQDNWEPARKEFEAAIAIDPAYIEALDSLGMSLEALSDDAGAVTYYEKAIAQNDERKGHFSSPYTNLGAYYTRTGDPGKGLEFIARAIELDPKSDRAWYQKAKASELQGHLDEAVESLKTAISFNARASSYYYVLSGYYRRLGKPEESRKALEEFTKLEKESNDLEKMRRSATNSAGQGSSAGGPRD